mmetsp:Transcript_69359/g.136391  ORF Transcript_69359/g.136391 Transcript_69359/m.136391 type:complete len:106 (-) Transcript_69359:412-729(-)
MSRSERAETSREDEDWGDLDLQFFVFFFFAGGNDDGNEDEDTTATAADDDDEDDGDDTEGEEEEEEEEEMRGAARGNSFDTFAPVPTPPAPDATTAGVRSPSAKA